MKVEEIPLTEKDKPYITLDCGCRCVLLKENPKAPNCIHSIVAEPCDEHEYKKGQFRNYRKDRVVHWDPLAEELRKMFG